MFTNQCSKCGEVFETKNPKRVICPNCLYPEGTIAAARPAGPPSYPQQRPYQPAGGYAPQGGGYGGGYNQPPGGGYGPPRPYNQQQGYGPRPQPGYGGGGYGHQQQGYGPRPQQGPPGGRPGPGYGPRPGGPGGRPPGNFGPRPGGPGGRPPGNFGPPRYGGPGRPPMGGRPGGRPPMQRGGPKKLLVTKEQLIQIEQLYKQVLPLPNPDAHEVIGEQINLAPSKVFFGINLVREKMRLPKLEYPKRKLAVTPEQLMAIETLYEPYLPLPPIGIHKIIAKQLRMDEWRVHVAIGLIRKNRNLARWNEDRDDLPAEMKKSQQKAREEKEKADAEKAQEEAKKATAAKKADKEAEASETAPAAQLDLLAENDADAAEATPKKARTAKAAVSVVDADSNEAAEADDAPVVKPKATRGRKAATAVAVVEEATETKTSDADADEEAEESTAKEVAAPKPRTRTTRATTKEK